MRTVSIQYRRMCAHKLTLKRTGGMDADDRRSAGGGLALSWSIWGKDRRCEIGHGQKGKMLMEGE